MISPHAFGTRVAREGVLDLSLGDSRLWGIPVPWASCTGRATICDVMF